MNCQQCVRLIALTAVLFGCQYSDRPVERIPMFVAETADDEKPWTDAEFLNDPENFQFAIVADLHGGYRRGIFEDAVTKLNLMQPEFVLSVGDLIAGYTEDLQTIDAQWAQFEERVAPLGMKFFFVPGNHDLSNLVMTQNWEKRFGQSYYHFIYRGVLFLCLNSEDPPDTHMSDAQIDYVGKVLADNTDVRWTFAFLHKPLWLEQETGWEKIEAMLAGRPHTVLAGHHHTYTRYERHGQSYIRLGTTGGGSSLSGPTKGKFDHITWVTVTDKGPVIANLALEGILDENIVTEESMRLVEFLTSKQWLNVGSIVVDANGFSTGTVEIALSNQGNHPLRLRGQFRQHPQLQLSDYDIDLTLEPGTAESFRVSISAADPISLSELHPLELKISGIYHPPGRLPIVAEVVHQVDFHNTWQGPEMIRNGSFVQGLEGWITDTRTEESGTLSAEFGMLNADVAVADPVWALVTHQSVGTLKRGVDYQVAFSAKSRTQPGLITIVMKDATSLSGNVPIRVDGQVKDRHLTSLTTSMKPYTMSFRIETDEDIEQGALMFVFAKENEVTIDEVSLRTILAGNEPRGSNQ